MDFQLDTEKLLLVVCWAVQKIQVECGKAVLFKTIIQIWSLGFKELYYSRVHTISDSLFSKILEKLSIVQR